MRAPGINCDVETKLALDLCGAQAKRVHVIELLEKRERLSDYDIVVIPGGFCYGDYVSSGKILGNKIKFNLRSDFEDFILAGKVVVGVCNGFQVLVKCGMLPGGDGEPFSEAPTCTLFQNRVGRFQDRWVRIKNVSRNRPIMEKVRHVFSPVNHGEGQFIPGSKEVLQWLYDSDQVLFKYVDETGHTADWFPDNPNGAVDGIAGISNKAGNVIGLMPHPEKFLAPQNHPFWTALDATPNPDGLNFYGAIVNYSKQVTK
jgi:phosphoribosylformylglycinamidine synthase